MGTDYADAVEFAISGAEGIKIDLGAAARSGAAVLEIVGCEGFTSALLHLKFRVDGY